MHITHSRTFRLVSVALTILVSAESAVAAGAVFQTPYVTRAEAVMLLLQARVPVIPALNSKGEFPDVPKGVWYERYIVVGERLGIIQRSSITRRIRPEDPVTRAEFLSMAAKTFGVTTTFPSIYRDVPPQSWYALGAGLAYRLALFPSDPDQFTFKPDEFMIHSDVAKAVQMLSDATAPDGQGKTALHRSAGDNISTVTLIKPRGSTPNIPAPVKVAEPDAAQLSRWRQDVLALVNAERAAVKLPGLKNNAMLETSAQQYAQDMARLDFFGHVSPAGQTLKERMEKSGYYRAF